eukprot:TRINITY_DN2015_c0_g4_i1.p1 TRINITY_DN2015_c0_g4~~TRINITY_DN2015_c0_g4_i1.p1  ORF type:complete len:473 (-),score=39.16 TRINITY_DN2015_c0_g4_i1:1142-2560(-)
MKPIRIVLVLLCLLSFLHSEKIKEVSSIVGVRDNQLIGYGLVVGLNGTGDGTSSTFTAQSLANLLQGVNVKVNANDIKSKNVAAVMVTAKLPAFARQGDKLDVIVSSIGDAKSIGGGTLLMTPLKGVDGKIYALAQGPVGIGGRNARGGGGDGNHPLAGVLLGGGVVERSVAYSFANQTRATISLKNANFMNAVAIQNTINQYFLNSAEAHDPRTVTVEKPDDMSMVEFLATVNELEITYDREQKVVIHERTGTVVAGIDVTVEPVVVTQGEITVQIDYPSNVVDGGIDMGDGINIDANKNIINSNNRPTVANIARSLQKLGATPKDIISVIEAMKMAGAITATVEIIQGLKMQIDNTQALNSLSKANTPNGNFRTDDLAKLREQTDAFESLIIKNMLDISMKMENSILPEEPGKKIYNSMYKDTLSKELAGGFGYSDLMFNYLKEKLQQNPRNNLNFFRRQNEYHSCWKTF